MIALVGACVKMVGISQKVVNNKMSDTMINMQLVHADNLNPDQLMIGDLIKIDEDILEVISIDSDGTGDNYTIETQNEFGENDFVILNYQESVKLFVFIDNE